MTHGPETLFNVFAITVVWLFLRTHVITVHAKKLVVLAGPYETGGDDVNEWFSTYAASDGSGASSLSGWRWPTFAYENITKPPSQIFDLTVDKDHTGTTMQAVLLSAIQMTWNHAENGVIIGSRLYDRVGETPYTGYDAVGALEKIVDLIGVAAEDVLVALIYRRPRVSQWGSIWWNHFEANLGYENFVCSKDDSEKRSEWLQNSMNPLFVAKTYHDKGWNIVVVDQEGTEKARKDVAHSIACFALEGDNCNDNWVSGLEDATINSPPTHEIDGLDINDIHNLEQLFLGRDCFYMTELDGSFRFTLLNENNIECDMSLRQYYEQYSDAGFVMNAIQSQKACEQNHVDISALLAQENELSRLNAEKTLVVVVGPHETEAESVLMFFETNASTGGNSEAAPSFNGWLWPGIDPSLVSDAVPSHIFDLLVTATDGTDQETRNALLGAIREGWFHSRKGIIIGSLLLDRVGRNLNTNYDPTKAIQDVVDVLGLQENQVRIVVTYRTPNIDHWASVWSKHFGASLYTDFVCSDEQASKRYEWLDSVLNTFKIAKTYHDQGWSVTVIDQEGTIDAGMDVSHTVACTILEDVDCNHGWVKGLEDIQSKPLSTPIIDALTAKDQEILNQLFLLRDCFYKYELAGEAGFSIINQHTAWSLCSREHKALYKQISETDFMLSAIQSQVGCAQDKIDLSELLAGTAPSVSVNSSEYSSSEQGNLDMLTHLAVALAILAILVTIMAVCLTIQNSRKFNNSAMQRACEGVFLDTPDIGQAQRSHSCYGIESRQDYRDEHYSDEGPTRVMSNLVGEINRQEQEELSKKSSVFEL